MSRSVLVFVVAGMILLTPAVAGADDLGQCAPTTEAVALAYDEPKKDDPPKEKDDPPKKEKKTPKPNCRWVDVNCRMECVPGCDPPDEKGTVKGCSSCHHKEERCDKEWRCDPAS